MAKKKAMHEKIILSGNKENNPLKINTYIEVLKRVKKKDKKMCRQFIKGCNFPCTKGNITHKYITQNYSVCGKTKAVDLI